MAKATLTISSKNYSSWALRGWLLTKFSGLEVDESVTAPDDASARAEILLLSSSILVPCLRHEGATVWDTLAIAEYLNEVTPDAALLPKDRILRAHCRSICGEIHSGFTTLRASLPVNLKGHFPGFKIWSRAQADIDRVCTIWRDCLAKSGGPFLFGGRAGRYRGTRGRILGSAGAPAACLKGLSLGQALLNLVPCRGVAPSAAPNRR